MTSVPRLHLIGPLDGLSAREYVEVAARAVSGGVDAVHARMPGATARNLLALARELAAIEGAALIVNDRLDVALLAGAIGAQLGEQGLGVADARRLLGPDALIGRSVHDLGGARQAARDGADYLLAGHIFDTPSKQGTPGRGLDWLAQVAGAVDIPVVALGGVTAERVPDMMRNGAWGVAMGRELLRAGDPATAARKARLALDAARKRTGSET